MLFINRGHSVSVALDEPEHSQTGLTACNFPKLLVSNISISCLWLNIYHQMLSFANEQLKILNINSFFPQTYKTMLKLSPHFTL